MNKEYKRYFIATIVYSILYFIESEVCVPLFPLMRR
jgi:hypothetical protein